MSDQAVQLTRQIPLPRTNLLNATTANTGFNNVDGAVDTGTDATATFVNTSGIHGAQVVEIQKTGAGSCSVTPMGSYDGGTTWYQIGYQQIDAQATLTRSVGAKSIAVTNPLNMTVQLLDYYPLVRLAVTAVSGSVSVSAWIHGVPA